MRMAIYYVGRGLQILGMWMLAVDLFTAGPLGPNPNLFYAGIGVFIAGWGVAKLSVKL